MILRYKYPLSNESMSVLWNIGKMSAFADTNSHWMNMFNNQYIERWLVRQLNSIDFILGTLSTKFKCFKCHGYSNHSVITIA